MTAVEKLFVDRGYHTPDQRAAFAEWMLGKKYQFRPYYYAVCELGRENEVSQPNSAPPSVLATDMA
jgi:hypothetical protein